MPEIIIGLIAGIAVFGVLVSAKCWQPAALRGTRSA
jgi:hypothetical protein